ncbi:PqqD family protein [Shimazuella kribbensis]|uniref:PqqD family protein n=1 Tax=Shimazuella kribbensis TaxID=139808 RepID=UPI000401C218|nr:PqqD family protein [Shimazuella kribbensis]
MYIVPEYIQITEIEEKYVLLDCRDNYFYGISKSGGEFLEQIKSHGDLEKAIKRLSNVYNISLDRIEEDMVTFLEKLSEKGLILKR